MKNIRKGIIISESQYGCVIFSEIISDITGLYTEKAGVEHLHQQQFKAKVIEVNGVPKANGSIIDYLIGGTYGADINVVKY